MTTHPNYQADIAAIRANVPQEMQQAHRWLGWRWSLKKGKWTKVPWSGGDPGSSTDPKTWTEFHRVMRDLKDGRYDGVGFVFAEGDGLVFVDIDHCRNSETSEIDAAAPQMIIFSLNSYSEVSPSGTGIHIYLRGKLPPGGHKKGRFEFYETGRFATVTGNVLTPSAIETYVPTKWVWSSSLGQIAERQKELDEVHALFFGALKPKAEKRERTSTPRPAMDASDAEIINLLMGQINGAKFSALWGGETLHPSASESDMALARLIAFRAGRDTARIDRIFRQSPRYDQRAEKWDRTGAETIERVLGAMSDDDFYSAGKNGRADVSVETCEPAKSEISEKTTESGQADNSPISHFAPSQRKPPEGMKSEAYYGLAGDIVRAIDPHTEADPDAVLIQVLAIFGAIAGRKTHSKASADRHYPNLYVALVGDTAAGRKGMAWGAARHVYTLLPEVKDWLSEHTVGGMSSGEGLIHPVRDYRPKDGDEGESKAEMLQLDKRVIVRESEFSSVLKMPSRDGNNLSEVQRRAWDGDVLQTLTKNSPERATGAHIVIVGNITPQELVRHLSQTDTANGFGNRYLWVHSERSKLLPDGGDLDSVNLKPLADRLRAAITFMTDLNEHHVMTRDPEAGALWRKEYGRLTCGSPGLFGAMTARGAPQVLRLSMIYALMDCSQVVRLPHLCAALAVWEYAEDSVRYIFGDALGDPIADTILRKLRRTPEGVTRTDISALFARHAKAEEIDRGLTLLQEHNLARSEKEPSDGGRSTERWFSTMLMLNANGRNAKEAKKAPPTPTEGLISLNSQFAPSQTSADTYEHPSADVGGEVAEGMEVRPQIAVVGRPTTTVAMPPATVAPRADLKPTLRRHCDYCETERNFRDYGDGVIQCNACGWQVGTPVVREPTTGTTEADATHSSGDWGDVA